jgi:hypothetical protein
LLEPGSNPRHKLNKRGKEMTGRPTYYGQTMKMRPIYAPGDLWERVRAKSLELSKKAGRKITMSDLVRKALENLLKEI